MKEEVSSSLKEYRLPSYDTIPNNRRYNLLTLGLKPGASVERRWAAPCLQAMPTKFCGSPRCPKSEVTVTTETKGAALRRERARLFLLN